MKWEYRALPALKLLPGITEDHSSYREMGNVDAANLGKLGRKGWELVAVYNDVAYFKRDISASVIAAREYAETVYG